MAQSSSKVVPQDPANKIKVKVYIERRCTHQKPQILVTYNQTPPHTFISKLRKFVMESKAEQCMAKFQVSLEWEEAMHQPAKPKRKQVQHVNIKGVLFTLQEYVCHKEAFMAMMITSHHT